MIPAAPRSSARPTRSRSADCGRTIGAIERRPDGVQQGKQVGLGRGAVLEVEDDPVEPGPAGSSAANGEARSRERRR